MSWDVNKKWDAIVKGLGLGFPTSASGPRVLTQKARVGLTVLISLYTSKTKKPKGAIQTRFEGDRSGKRRKFLRLVAMLRTLGGDKAHRVFMIC